MNLENLTVTMDGDNSPLTSLCMVRAAELFPKPDPEREDESLHVQFKLLAGEFVKYIGRTDNGILALSNYRICLKQETETEISIPLGVIEYASIRDLFHLVISCKDASTFKCPFSTSEQCSEWQRRITLSVGIPNSLESLFSFSFYAWSSEQNGQSDLPAMRLQRASIYDENFRNEVKRLDFNINTTWRISTANIDFKLCPSYPRLLLVPCCITDETLTNVASFRSSRRIPAVVWRHKASGAVIARCSQPEVGWLGWRNPKDEQLLKAIADACAFDGGEAERRQHKTSVSSENSSTDGSHEEVCMDEVKKILIVDARSYASAVTNRARGGGCECPEYYPCAQIEFMSLGNIHVIRKSFHALRQLCSTPTDSPNWFTSLDRTMWLTHVASMLQSSMTICHTIEREGRPVVVHCSDGWDRTPQLVATSLLCLDPYYRTIEGFQVLVEREWLSFGHKFADRIGHGPGSDETNERCPVFLQWLDCVHQILKQFPCCFEFSMGYLVKLAQHVFSCMFGTFLCNTYKERIENSVFDRTYCVWSLLSNPIYRNPLYISNREQVLWPAYHLSNMSFWFEVYLSSFGNQNQMDNASTTNISPTPPAIATTNSIGTAIVTPSTNDITNSEPRSPMTKTRSFGDLQTASPSTSLNTLTRRSSDPNMTVDVHFNLNLSSGTSAEKVSDFTDRNVINDETIANFCSDTSRELNNLTEELQHSDLDISKRNSCNQQQLQEEPHSIDLMSTMPTANVINSLNNDCCDGDVVDSSPFYSQLENQIQSPERISSVLENCQTDMNEEDERLAYLLRSVDLRDTSPPHQEKSSDGQQSPLPWRGNIETSTDTLVPMIESTQSDDGSNALLVAEQQSDATIFPLHRITIDSDVSRFTNAKTIDESIVIQPEHQRMEITNSVGDSNGITNDIVRRRRNSLNAKLQNFDVTTHNGCTGRRSFNENSVRNVQPSNGFNQTKSSQTVLPSTAVASASANASILFDCLDGLSHTLKEQDLRLHQIVHEHKLREEALQKELHAIRLAMLQKTSCSNCTNCSSVNATIGSAEETPSIVDNGVENVSVSSWEAVEERSGPSSGASSSQAMAASVLWVPDYAVTQCTTCKTEFWLGRRKHHCRSCGQIFCADCSEFWAALPDERLFDPVRLCGPCYHNVTTNMQQQPVQQSQQTTINSYSCHQFIGRNANNFTANSTEQCKHAASTNGERNSLKATTATK